jgi:hypothetical protein
MAAVREWEELAAAIEIGKDDEAERSQKRIFFNARGCSDRHTSEDSVRGN